MVIETTTKPTTTINAKDLRRALHQLLPAAAKHWSSLEIIKDVLITPATDGLVLECTDLETGLRVKVEAVDAMALSGPPVIVPIRPLREVVKSFGGEIELSCDEERLILQDANRLIRLRRDCNHDFPITPQLDDEIRWVEVPGFIGRLRAALVASSLDESRPALTSVFITSLEMVATDTHRLHRITHEKTLDPWPEDGVIVPRWMLDNLPRMLGAKADDAVLMGLPKSAKPGVIHFRFNGAHVVSRLSDAKYPNYQHVIPTESDRSWTVNNSAMIGCLRSIAAIAEDDAGRVVLTEDGCNLVISAESRMLGEASVKAELFDTTGDNAGFKIAAKLQYLTDALGMFPPGSAVTISMTGNLSAIKFTSEVDGSKLAVVMPMVIR